MDSVQDEDCSLLGTSRSPFPLASRARNRQQTKLKIVLNGSTRSPEGFQGGRRGYYKAEGSSPRSTRATGYGAAVPLVANGQYD